MEWGEFVLCTYLQYTGTAEPASAPRSLCRSRAVLMNCCKAGPVTRGEAEFFLNKNHLSQLWGLARRDLTIFSQTRSQIMFSTFSDFRAIASKRLHVASIYHQMNSDTLVYFTINRQCLLLWCFFVSIEEIRWDIVFICISLLPPSAITIKTELCAVRIAPSYCWVVVL